MTSDRRPKSLLEEAYGLPKEEPGLQLIFLEPAPEQRPSCQWCHRLLIDVPKSMKKKGVNYRALKLCPGCCKFFKRV